MDFFKSNPLSLAIAVALFSSMPLHAQAVSNNEVTITEGFDVESVTGGSSVSGNAIKLSNFS